MKKSEALARALEVMRRDDWPKELTSGVCLALFRAIPRREAGRKEVTLDLAKYLQESMGGAPFVHVWLNQVHGVSWKGLTPEAVYQYRLRWVEDMIRQFKEEEQRAQEG